MEPMTCHASGLPIPDGAAYIIDADGNTYLPEHYEVPDEPKVKAKA